MLTRWFRTPTAVPPLSPSAHLRMAIINRIFDLANPGSVLEIGPGLGAAAWRLAEGRVYRGYEPDAAAFEVARERLSGRPNASVHNELLPEEPDRLFEAVVAFEVLEHIEDDTSALSCWRRWLEPGGTLIISVPAKQRRYGRYDELVGHYRRYERGELVQLLTAAGFHAVEIYSYGMPLGYLLEFVRNRLLARRLGARPDMGERSARSGRSFQPTGNATLLEALVWLFQKVQRPFERTDLGIGYVALGQVSG